MGTDEFFLFHFPAGLAQEVPPVYRFHGIGALYLVYYSIRAIRARFAMLYCTTCITMTITMEERKLSIPSSLAIIERSTPRAVPLSPFSRLSSYISMPAAETKDLLIITGTLSLASEVKSNDQAVIPHVIKISSCSPE
ncbi:uncharacterized protein MCYG_07965 [Microsporum canis CBS 113480]|uniref:Uncharacterized protein n=1 Tax=Arthroderma otae (strain ATCC MYA-4605 / CBS 113480) TaxID=554155 RepID=C5FZ43_ARTOC|nr:uncharacterized protein MCYG_07965 [Microsporum canis CBS 113480]EEQ35146.1 predicted protein [Microsporum canis CBS 113480]